MVVILMCWNTGVLVVLSPRTVPCRATVWAVQVIPLPVDYYITLHIGILFSKYLCFFLDRMKADFNLLINSLVKGLDDPLFGKYCRSRLLRERWMTLRHRVPKSVGLRLSYRSLQNVAPEVKRFILCEHRQNLLLKLFLDGRGEGLSDCGYEDFLFRHVSQKLFILDCLLKPRCGLILFEMWLNCPC